MDRLVPATLAATKEFHPSLGVCEAALSKGSPEHKEMKCRLKPAKFSSPASFQKEGIVWEPHYNLYGGSKSTSCLRR
jgi:hypothetical protein